MNIDAIYLLCIFLKTYMYDRLTSYISIPSIFDVPYFFHISLPTKYTYICYVAFDICLEVLINRNIFNCKHQMRFYFVDINANYFYLFYRTVLIFKTKLVSIDFHLKEINNKNNFSKRILKYFSFILSNLFHANLFSV